ncbi:MAG: hypothetical protein KF850_15590 [Labilithrix sp.]|nr:hypothetical protein [Labilithrix sp.]
MRPRSVLSAVPLAAALLFAAACTRSDGWYESGPRPHIVSVTGPSLSDGRVRNTVLCSPDATAGACPMTLGVTFRLPEEHFVWKALVRFQNDGSEDGVDREYLVEERFGGGDADVSVNVPAFVPPGLIRAGTLNRFSVRLVSGAGELSDPSTLAVTIQEPPREDGEP